VTVTLIGVLPARSKRGQVISGFVGQVISAQAGVSALTLNRPLAVSISAT
jgi:hypothetical protein